MSDPDLGLDATYRSYEASGAAGGRWSPANAGNRAIHLERNAAFAAALHDRAPQRVLEVGCGDASLLDEIAAMVPSAACAGVELLRFRLDAARTRGATSPVVNADGARLPFADATFDIVVLATVLSSVLDDPTAVVLASDAARVVRRGGAVLWYDMRQPNPANRAVRPIGRARLHALFPGFAVRARSITLNPLIARRLGPLTRVGYRALAALPPLRSHLFAVLERTESRRVAVTTLPAMEATGA